MKIFPKFHTFAFSRHPMSFVEIIEVVTVADLNAEKCGADLEAEVWSYSYFFRLSTKSDQDSEVEVQAKFGAENWAEFCY